MFSFRRFSSSDDPWFRIGEVAVTTTLFIAGLTVISMFVWAAEGSFGPIFRNLWLISDNPLTGSVLDGQLWRLFTWPIPNQPDFWNVVLIVVFVMLGSQLEAMMGRRPYTWFVGGLVLVPALLVTVLELLLSVSGGAFGLRFVELGILIAFAAHNPKALFWPGIPAWILAGIIIAIDYLQIIGNRDDYDFALLSAIVVVALVGVRSLGYAEDLQWIPRLPLPERVSGTATTQRRPQRSGGNRRRRSRGNLRAVPAPNPGTDRTAEMEIDALLDQVASQGLDSLTKAQRKRLEQHSRELRRRRDQD